jgi:hypothetical protein
MKPAKNNSDGKKKGNEKANGKTQKDELSDEWKRVGYFFEWFDPEGAKEQIWEILKLALVADNDQADERERSNMIFFYENVTVLFENVFKIWKRKRKKMTREEILQI